MLAKANPVKIEDAIVEDNFTSPADRPLEMSPKLMPVAMLRRELLTRGVSIIGGKKEMIVALLKVIQHSTIVVQDSIYISPWEVMSLHQQANTPPTSTSNTIQQ